MKKTKDFSITTIKRTTGHRDELFNMLNAGGPQATSNQNLD